MTGPDVSYFVFVHKGIGVLGGFSNAEEANNRLICAANNKVFPDPNDAYCEGDNTKIQVTRSEGQGASFDSDTNNVYAMRAVASGRNSRESYTIGRCHG